MEVDRNPGMYNNEQYYININYYKLSVKHDSEASVFVDSEAYHFIDNSLVSVMFSAK